jgi:hypothetical protein
VLHANATEADIFSATGVDQDGNHISAHFASHVTFVDGSAVVAFGRGAVEGCP